MVIFENVLCLGMGKKFYWQIFPLIPLTKPPEWSSHTRHDESLRFPPPFARVYADKTIKHKFCTGCVAEMGGNTVTTAWPQPELTRLPETNGYLWSTFSFFWFDLARMVTKSTNVDNSLHVDKIQPIGLDSVDSTRSNQASWFCQHYWVLSSAVHAATADQC